MDIYEMRKRVSKAYPGDKWKTRVRNMTDDQIIAIFYRLVEKGKIKGV